MIDKLRGEQKLKHKSEDVDDEPEKQEFVFKRLLQQGQIQETRDTLFCGSSSCAPLEDCKRNIFLPTVCNLVPEEQSVQWVVGGASHGLVVSNTGKIYSWGADCGGQLGRRVLDAHRHEKQRDAEADADVQCDSDSDDSVSSSSSAKVEEERKLMSPSERSIADREVEGISWSSSKGRSAHRLSSAVDSKGNLFGRRGSSVGNDNIFLERNCTIAAGQGRSAAITSGGDVFLWGGMHCKRNLLRSDFPWKMPFQEVVRSIALGSEHVLVLTKDRHVFSAGLNDAGQLGLSRSNKILKEAFKFARVDVPAVQQIACGARFSLVLSTQGQMYSFGDALRGRLGQSDEMLFPEPITGVACRATPGWVKINPQQENLHEDWHPGQISETLDQQNSSFISISTPTNSISSEEKENQPMLPLVDKLTTANPY